MTTSPCCTITNASTFTTLPSIAPQEAKEKRRKVLEAARARRKIIHTRYFKKLRVQQHTS